MLYIPNKMRGLLEFFKKEFSNPNSNSKQLATDYQIDVVKENMSSWTDEPSRLFVEQLKTSMAFYGVDLYARSVDCANFQIALKDAILTFRKRLVFDRIIKFRKDYAGVTELEKYTRVERSGFLEEIVLDLDGSGHGVFCDSLRAFFVHGTYESGDIFTNRRFRRDAFDNNAYYKACRYVIERGPTEPLVTTREFDSLNVPLKPTLSYIFTGDAPEQQENTMSITKPTSISNSPKTQVAILELIVKTATSGSPKGKEAAWDLASVFGISLFCQDKDNPEFFLKCQDQWDLVQKTIDFIQESKPVADGLTLANLLKLTPNKANWDRVISFLENDPKKSLAVEGSPVLAKMLKNAKAKAEAGEFDKAFVLIETLNDSI